MKGGIESVMMDFPGEGHAMQIQARDSEGRLAGTVFLNLEPGSLAFEFCRLWVRDDLRLQGVGRKLLQVVSSNAASCGAHSIFCAVHPKNNDAREFYRRLGFHIAYQFPDGDYLMTLRLQQNGGAA